MTAKPIKDSGVLKDQKAVKGFFKVVFGERLESVRSLNMQKRYAVEFNIVGGSNLDMIRERFEIVKITADTGNEETTEIWVSSARDSK